MLHAEDGIKEPTLSNPTRSTRRTSVMPISVTSHETRETITTYVNGRRITREEVGKIYVIEPVEEWHRDQLKEREEGNGANIIRDRRWLADLWLGVWVVWAAFLVYEWWR